MKASKQASKQASNNILAISGLLLTLLFSNSICAQQKSVVVIPLGGEEAGFEYVDHGEFGDTTALGSFPPPLPAGYFMDLPLTPGRYYVTGDTTIKNEDSSKNGVVVCNLYVDETTNTTNVFATLPITPTDESYAQLSYASSFVIANAGDTKISHRCYEYRTANGASADLVYWYGNMTVFKLK